MSSSHVDVLIVGAGVIGLAIARELAIAGREVLVIEAAEAIGTQTSVRNSGVIHAGLYYPTGSLKARLCVSGRKRLYAYCSEKGVAHQAVGKLIVATDEHQRPQLERLAGQALVNGVEDIEMLDAAAAMTLEPELHCVAALYSRSTGIVDAYALMQALQGDAEAHGASVICRAPFVAARITSGSLEVTVGGEEPMSVQVNTLINAAGLGAWQVAGAIEALPPSTIPQGHLAKGNYFALATGRVPFRHLIYPLPREEGLGIHVALDVAGRARFGPDVEWLDDERFDYSVSTARASLFDAAIRQFWRGLPKDALVPADAGVRPKLSGPGELAADFMIVGPMTHGIPGLVNLFGIDSPGLTSSLAIAAHVARLLE